jgi:hypothetical protein
MDVWGDDALNFEVRVAYCISKRCTTLHGGELTICSTGNRAVYSIASRSYDTKFDLKRAIDLPRSSGRCAVLSVAPHGQTPKFGTLHPSLMVALRAAYRAATG